MISITRVNPPNDFWQTFIPYGSSAKELKSLGFSKLAIDWNANLNQEYEGLIFALKEFPSLINFIKKQMDGKNIFFVKTHPYQEPNTKPKTENDANFRYYISFGGYPDEGAVSVLSLRLDQSWEDFKIPSFVPLETQNELLRHLPYLSGAIIGSLETPSILDEQYRIDNGVIDYRTTLSKEIVQNLKGYFRIGCTYYGWVFLVDNKGNILEWDSSVSQQWVVKPTKMNYLEWLQKDLSNPFLPYHQWRGGGN